MAELLARLQAYNLQEMADIPKSLVRTVTVHENTDPEELQNSFQSENQDRPCQDKKETESCQPSCTENAGPDAVVFLKSIYYYTESTKYCKVNSTTGEKVQLCMPSVRHVFSQPPILPLITFILTDDEIKTVAKL
ncbi:PREDICTED: uncharacterized protein LOC109581831 [Amphimedon queenslandica]|uniref:Uncharacterized protein n=1 Tax=Amphimedon queenslandica TaxID=400682 RepID=A0AAN0J529_AMPQE|nr:PREDICTED: uncharacterized protein LOC109581831 [Amphimedon queenslandica]|eukprot:XP_019851813.1 PREDICTED: uncharacterized protein LOC109581831 [Amphimedon queenslandica]